MAILAHWEEADGASGTPREPRRKLRLAAHGALSSGASGEILIHDISASGLLIESGLPLSTGERIALVLPEAGETWAEVVWASGKLFGCRFDAPVSPAALSAAQLRAAVGQPMDLEAAGAATIPIAPADGRSDASFGARLQRMRRERGVSQAYVATQLGVSKPTVWAWEHDKARPIDSRMEDLANILGVAPSELVAVPGNAEVVERSRGQIATAFGLAPDRVRIWVEL